MINKTDKTLPRPNRKEGEETNPQYHDERRHYFRNSRHLIDNREYFGQLFIKTSAT